MKIVRIITCLRCGKRIAVESDRQQRCDECQRDYQSHLRAARYAPAVMEKACSSTQ
jgi:hypothetical protein